MLYVFGDFELNKQEFSLQQGGRRLPLEPRALNVLITLVEQQGHLVEKKALLSAVWKDTFVEETTLTRAIAVVRKTLQDDPRAPRFIETIPTRGYRFIAPVQVGSSAAASSSPAPAEPVHTEAVLQQQQIAPSEVTVAPQLTSAPRNRKPLVYGALFCCLIALVAWFWSRHAAGSARAFNTTDTLVLADFSNTTGDPVFDDALRQGMLVQLEQSPVLRLASDGKIRTTLKLMGKQAETRLTPEVGREVCQRLGADVVLDGSISRLGSEYIIGLRGRSCSTGEELDAEQVQIARKEDALNALTQVAERFRRRIGEASATLRNFDTPLQEAATPSLDALRAFSKGVSSFNGKGSRAALPLFQQATELDPQFATAHAWLGRMYADLGEETLAIASTRRAYELRDHASERERFAIDVSYESIVTGNLEKARMACEAWLQMYPRDVYPRAFLAGVVYPAFGQQERALAEARTSISIDPDFVLGYRNAAVALIALNRPQEASQVLAQASQRKLNLASFVTLQYRVAYLQGDEQGMTRASESAPTNPWLLFNRAATHAQRGELAQARTIQEQALTLSRRGNRKDLEAELLVNCALTRALYGQSAEAASQAIAALQLSPARSATYTAALVLAQTGHTDQALRVADSLARTFPQDTMVQNNYVPTIRAAVALAAGNPQKAVQFLAPTAQFEPGIPLYPAYLRGQALLALGQGAPAAAEFRKITEHPGPVLNDPLLSLAELQLARAEMLSQNKASAKAPLTSLLARWQRADAGLAPVTEARSLSGKLQ